MLYAAKSHIGLVRQMNQDVFSVLPDLLPRRFYVIADGMGGPPAGEVASQLAVETVIEVVAAAPAQAGAPDELLRKAIYVANQKIFLAAQANEEYQGMGTTFVCALVDKDEVVFAHVGDTRGYLLQDGQLRQTTNDHSLVAELVRRGQLTEAEAAVHPRRNIVIRSLGTEAQSDPDIDAIPWRKGDVVLLCTDGLSNLLTADELHEQMQRICAHPTQDTLNHVADGLLRLALERGGPDNITLILVLHDEEGDAHV